jgi:hypothetical protein
MLARSAAGRRRRAGLKQSLLDHFREQAGFCVAFGSPFTARLIEAMARDLEAGGPTAALVGDWPGPPRADAVSLRLAGALHAAALSGRDAAPGEPRDSVRFLIDVIHWPGSERRTLGITDGHVRFIDSNP